MTSSTLPDSTAEMFASIDALDAEGFAKHFAPEGRLTFGNAPAMVGPDQIAAGCAGFFETIGGMNHRLVNAWTVGEDTLTELEVTYTRKDGGQVAVPVMSIWKSDADELIVDYRVFFDLAPVFA